MSDTQRERMLGKKAVRGSASPATRKTAQEALRALAEHAKRTEAERQAESPEGGHTETDLIQHLRGHYPNFTNVGADNVNFFEKVLVSTGLPTVEALVLGESILQDVQILPDLKVTFASPVGVHRQWALQYASRFASGEEDFMRQKMMDEAFGAVSVALRVRKYNGVLLDQWKGVDFMDAESTPLSDAMRICAAAHKWINGLPSQIADLVSVHSRWFLARCHMVISDDVEALLGNG